MTTRFHHNTAQNEANRLFGAGLAAHQEGRLDDAFAAYEQVLGLAPRHFDALHHVGILGYQTCNYELALQFIQAAIEVNPGVSSVYSNLGNIFKAIGEQEAALQSYEQALGLDAGNVDALYNRGNVLQGLKRYEEALASYDQAIALAPGDVESWNNCAVVLQHLKRYEEALGSCNHAITLNPGHAEAFNNRGNILVLLGRADAALGSFEQAIALRPPYIEARVNLGQTLRVLGRLDESMAAYDAALALVPGSADALHGRGNTLRQLKRADEALADFEKAVILKPDSASFRTSLGSMLHELGRFHLALECFDAALGLDPELTVLHNGRGLVLQRLGHFKDALACFDQVLALEPGHLDAMLNRGNVLGDLGRTDDALACYDEVLRVKGETAPLWNNRGNVYESLRRYEDALACFDRAIALSPEYAVAHWNRALLNLQHGRLDEGWRGYEWRWKNEALSVYRQKRDFTQPLWLGQDSLEGKTILLFAEQGLGDTLQFCRYVPLVAARGARVILEVQGALAGLLGKLEGVGELVVHGDPLPPFDFQAPLMTLPLAFGTGLRSIPAPPRYLAADAARLGDWLPRLGAHVRPRVGLVWSGNPHHSNDHNRSVPFAQLARLFELDCQFVSLQKEYRAGDLALLDASGVLRMDEHLKDFSDTAALCELMDLVISVDTSVAHLAGALGKPLWLLLPQVADWRWLTERTDAPWYPSARLFRQSEAGDWEGVFDAVKQALGALPHP
jgi:tetratricopeptide (TPR) repeat protein